MSVITHITTREAWEATAGQSHYGGDTLDTEGFIHCSTPAQVADTANRYFLGRSGLVLLCIDEDAVEPEIRYEGAPGGAQYPHVYGPLNRNAVTRALPFEPGRDGRFTLPAELRDAVEERNTTMDFQHIQSETRDGVLVLRLNDPATRNALGPELTAEVEQELDRFERDDSLRVLVLTGTDPAFSSGANVRGFQAGINRQAAEAPPAPSPWEQLDPARYAQSVTRTGGPALVLRLYHLQKPSIAAVNGAAYGLGCGIALSCDIRIASERARFSEAFVRNGLIPADGSCWQLPRLIGVSNTLLLQYTGDPIEGAEAHRLGMCSRVVPHEELMDATMQLATRLAQGPTYSMSLIKMLVQKAAGQTLEEHLVEAQRAQNLARRTEDHREGVRAFLEKRQPQFKGR